MKEIPSVKLVSKQTLGAKNDPPKVDIMETHRNNGHIMSETIL